MGGCTWAREGGGAACAVEAKAARAAAVDGIFGGNKEEKVNKINQSTRKNTMKMNKNILFLRCERNGRVPFVVLWQSLHSSSGGTSERWVTPRAAITGVASG